MGFEYGEYTPLPGAKSTGLFRRSIWPLQVLEGFARQDEVCIEVALACGLGDRRWKRRSGRLLVPVEGLEVFADELLVE
mgnify:CR=1 FL=1